MRSNIVFMFSGQGSQYLNMGREFYESIPLFRKQMHRLDQIPQDISGISIVDILYGHTSRKPEKFDNILYTHPALFMVQYSLAQCLLNNDIKPGYLLGASLGEWVALSVGGAISPEDALQVVVNQAQLVSSHCPSGGMMAVLDRPKIFDQLATHNCHCELAGINFDNHFCISGSLSELEKAANVFEKNGIIADYLPVKQPFHSSLIDHLKPVFLKIVEKISIQQSAIPIISPMAVASRTEYTVEDIWKIVRNPIMFYDTITNFMATNRLERGYQFIDIGPSGTLANFVKYGLGSKANIKTHSIMSPFGDDLVKYHSLNSIFSHNYHIQEVASC
jgi:bacillaene synthase trans-acting acyltransferase